MRRASTVTIVLLLLLAFLSACKKKQPQMPQPQTQAPTISTPTVPEPQPAPPQPQPTQPQPQPPAPEVKPPVTTTKPKPKAHKKTNAKKTPPKPPERKTVPEGGTETTGSGQLSARIPQDEVTQRRQSTAQLYVTTDNNLRSIKRTLSTDEQAMVQQIRTYIAQSRSADADGDTERAYNLALKAYLLSDELVKR